jgi:hypothetical protein
VSLRGTATPSTTIQLVNAVNTAAVSHATTGTAALSHAVVDTELSAEERHLLDLTATPAATLLGLVSMSLRTTLFGDDPVDWIDLWQAGPATARLEWQGGPDIADVVAHLTAKSYEGTLEGVPGLRPRTCTPYAAQMLWFATPNPVTLHLTRLE